jgi:hypothetical protein
MCCGQCCRSSRRWQPAISRSFWEVEAHFPEAFHLFAFVHMQEQGDGAEQARAIAQCG